MAKSSSTKWRNPFSNPVGLNQLQKKLFGHKRRKITWVGVAKFFAWSLGILILGLVFLFAWYAKDLPTPGKIRTLVDATGSTRLFDRNMKPLYTIAGDQKRIVVDSNQIPDIAKQATIAIEDRDFYHHAGVQPKAIIRAVFYDIFHHGQSLQGGSTITQQYVKNAIIKDSDRTFSRKIQEAILAIEMEALYSKDQILTLYLNYVPYGGNNYGIEAASRAFFNKSAKDLTAPEAATLAALIQRPSSLSPYGPNTQLLIARRNLDIDDMQQLGYISKDDAEKAKATELKVSPKHESITAPHFSLFVKDWLINYFTTQLGDRQLAEQKVEDGGYTVVTTLDLDKQQMAEQVVHDAQDSTLKRAGASNAGLVTIDPKRGEIITMVGSVDYYQPQFGTYNIATAKRQPGSSFKPIVYATAFKDKYNPAYTLFDLKTDFGNYVPENYDGKFRGPVSMRQALGNSLNIPAVKTLALVGVDKALKTASDFGITTLTNKDRYGLSLVLGGGEVEPLEMAGAYGVFANGGTYVPTTPILKITDSKGGVIYDHSDPKDGRQVLDPQIAYEISNILSDVNAKRPIFSNVLGVLTLKDRPVAVKTGTTNEFRDAWTIGYTPQYVTAVWAGNNDNSPMNKATGAIAAAPIWDQVMEKLHAGLPVQDFQKPDGIQDVTVDKLSNKLPVNGSDTVTDHFASWQVPTTQDDVHVQLKVCKENGLLADDSIPADLTTLRTFINIHSEMPDNPNWEIPVQAWAAQNGLDNRPPTAKCTGGSDVTPTITITSPADHSSVKGQFTISANASAPSGVQSVEFLIDDTSIATVASSPYQTTYNTSSLSSGDHTISAVVTSNNGATATTRIGITVSNDTTPPKNVTGFNGIQGPGNGKITLSWINPTDSDFKSVRITTYKDSSGALVQSTEVSSPTNSLTVNGLTSGTAYRFTAQSVDTSGNVSSGVTIVLTAP